MLTENNLVYLKVDQEYIDKVNTYSIEKAIHMMDDFGWCPRPDCGKPAELNKFEK
jgi:hypothetical protein